MITPIAFLFDQQVASMNIWQSVTYRYPKQFTKKLAWREQDKRLDAFLEFIETNGKETELTPEVWQQIFFSHLAALTNQQFLFMLWCAANPPIDAPSPSQWLPQDIADNFTQWRQNWQTDELVTHVFENSYQEVHGHPLPSYRGVELPPIFMYESVRAVMSDALQNTPNK